MRRAENVSKFWLRIEFSSNKVDKISISRILKYTRDKNCVKSCILFPADHQMRLREVQRSARHVQTPELQQQPAVLGPSVPELSAGEKMEVRLHVQKRSRRNEKKPVRLKIVKSCEITSWCVGERFFNFFRFSYFNRSYIYLNRDRRFFLSRARIRRNFRRNK